MDIGIAMLLTGVGTALFGYGPIEILVSQSVILVIDAIARRAIDRYFGARR